MSEPQAYFNGSWIPASAASISVTDAGFILGTTIAEQLRTFSGRIFRLNEHLDRLDHSLQAIEVDSGLTRRQWTDIAHELVAINSRYLTPGDDWGISIFVTPGQYPTYGQAHQKHNRPTVCMHPYPLPFYLWAEKYRIGQALATTPIQQIPSQCWPADIKCRSRMHYYLADKLALKKDHRARAVLLDNKGFVTETSTANILIYRKDEGLISPPNDNILHGISLTVVFELADKLGIPCLQRNISTEDLSTADEIILTSTPLCMLPATQFNSQLIGNGRPGIISQQLLTAWSEMVGLDIVGQAEHFAVR
jgi:branched-chain amino acid aminotransferase